MLPPDRWRASVRRGLPLALALGTGIAAYAVIGSAEEPAQLDPDGPGGPDDRVPTAQRRTGVRVALASGIGALAGASSAAGLALDGVLEQSLVRRGVRHPRLWVGVTAALVSEVTRLTAPSRAMDGTTTA